jgi:hypothetical protein
MNVADASGSYVHEAVLMHTSITGDLMWHRRISIGIKGQMHVTDAEQNNHRKVRDSIP